MTSAFAWLDYSAKERRAMLEIVDLFREKGTVDELGVGTIRDAFADAMFPGTSTLHTRARYLLFVPWVYLQLEEEKVKGSQMNERARSLQAALVRSLIAGGQSEGVIGIEAQEKLLRTPAMVYWGALRTLGVRLFPGSIEQYSGAVDSWYALGRSPQRGEDGEIVDAGRPNWHPGIPSPPNDLWQNASFALTYEEAAYLRERVYNAASDSLLAFCIRHPRSYAKVERPWELPHLDEASGDQRAIVEQARRFALLMAGAVLVYNVMLAEEARDAGIRDSSLAERYRSDLATWADGRVRPELGELRRSEAAGSLWDVVSRIGPASSLPARRFAGQWISYALADPWTVADSAEIRQLIERRERALKGGLARLTNPRALERWNGASGLGELTYRWPNARVVIADVVEGLKGVHDA